MKRALVSALMAVKTRSKAFSAQILGHGKSRERVALALGG